MECFSSKFRKLIKEILNSEKVLIATIAIKGDRFIEEIKQRGDVKSFEITHENRNFLVSQIIKEVKLLLP